MGWFWSNSQHDLPVRKDPIPENYFLNKEGLALYTQKWIPERPSGKVVVFAPGYGEHLGRHVELAEILKEHGYSVYAMDHQGMGKSEGERAYVEDFGNYILDLIQFIEIVKNETKSEKVFLIGHALGGFMAAGVALQIPDSLRGAFLCGPAMEADEKVAVGRVLSYFLPKATVPTELNPSHFTRDSKVVEEFINDPLNYHGKFKARFVISTLDWQNRVMAQANQIQVPICIAMGSEDKICTPQGAQKFFNAVGTEDKQFLTYEGFYHALFHEIGKERVFDDLLEWLGKH